MALPPAVQQDLRVFWSDPARVAKFKKDAMTWGWFVTLEDGRAKGNVGPAMFAFEYRRYYSETQDKITEALKEVEHIRKALKRMEMAAQQGAQRRSVEWLRQYPDDRHFQEGLRLFQAWLASLFESYVTLMAYVQGANGATQKVKEFASASLKLIETREQEQRMNTQHAELYETLLTQG